MTAGLRTLEDIRPCLEAWLDRGHGKPTYRLTQVLSEHGFGEFLYRIGRKPTAICHHCGADRDIAQHTLEGCPAWEAERGVLTQDIGGDLSLTTIIEAMVGSEKKWQAMASEQVMSQKEAAERAREREADAADARNPARRAGRRAARYRWRPPDGGR